MEILAGLRKSLVALTLVWSFAGKVKGDFLYTVTDLGGGQSYGINASGEVVGQNGVGHAFLYSKGNVTDLGTLGGSSSFALNINDSGAVVGWANNPGNTTQGFLYAKGTMVGLSTTGVSGGAQGINAAGQVAGWYSNSGTTAGGTPLGPTQAFLYSNGTRANLGSFPVGSDTYPLSINGSGQVVGYTYRPGITGEQPFLIQNGTTTILPVSGAFQMINASGQVAGGRYFSDTVWHAQLYNNGTLTDLGTLGGTTSWAYGINTGGQVVGDANTPSGAQHAFLYSNGTKTDLNDRIDPASGWTLKQAFAINDSGQIVGWGTNASGKSDAFLLTFVPEPGNFLLGDFNRDGHVNNADVPVMQHYLTDSNVYKTVLQYSDNQLLSIGDGNSDGKVNNADLQSLLNLLKAGGGSIVPVPEPSSLALMSFATIALLTGSIPRPPGRPARKGTPSRTGRRITSGRSPTRR